jgi:nicotinamide mononucleotide transporter
MALYGWRQWNKPLIQQAAVTSWAYSKHLYYIFGLTLLSVILALVADSVLDNQHLYLDAFVTVFSVFSTILVAHKVRENWLYWIVINVFASYLYFNNSLYLTSLLFVLYAFFAVYGYISWGKISKPSRLASDG